MERKNQENYDSRHVACTLKKRRPYRIGDQVEKSSESDTFPGKTEVPFLVAKGGGAGER